MSEIEIYKGELAPIDAASAGDLLMRLTPLPPAELHDEPRTSAAMLTALGAMTRASEPLQAAIQAAVNAGDGLRVAFPPEITRQLQNGTLHLMQTAKGTAPIAVNHAGQVASHASVVGGAVGASAAGSATGVGAAVAGASMASIAVAALPIVIAGAAAYAGQQQLTKSLDEIKTIVKRIEARLEDADSGVCDAAERFIALAQNALAEGGFTPYLALELAAQRTAVEGLYAARLQWVERFKAKLEKEQVEKEAADGRGQPWVSSIAKMAASGDLERELLLFIRALMSRTRLGVLAAAVLAEEGRGVTAMKLMNDLERELRAQFFDLHNRLKPLAKIAPEVPLKERVPLMKNTTQQAHETIKALVAHMNSSVLPAIPDPDDQREVVTVLSPVAVAELAATAA